MRMYCPITNRCSKKLLTVQRLYCVFVSAVILGAGTAAYILVGNQTVLYTVVMLVIIILFGALYLPEAWKKYGYERKDGQIKIIKGILFKRKIIIPRNQVQYISVDSTVLERLFGINTVRFVTTGGRIALRGIERDDAERLRRIFTGGK